MDNNKKLKDILNWAKSELAETIHPKLDKDLQSPYIIDKSNFLKKLIHKIEND